MTHSEHFYVLDGHETLLVESLVQKKNFCVRKYLGPWSRASAQVCTIDAEVNSDTRGAFAITSADVHQWEQVEAKDYHGFKFHFGYFLFYFETSLHKYFGFLILPSVLFDKFHLCLISPLCI